MTRDLIVFAGVVLSFSAWLTAHLTIVVGLALRRPRVRALVGLVIVPLAVYWAFRARMRVRGAVACGGLLAYAALRWLGRG